eukprot:4969366-Amphidinium_carterae.1
MVEVDASLDQADLTPEKAVEAGLPAEYYSLSEGEKRPLMETALLQVLLTSMSLTPIENASSFLSLSNQERHARLVLSLEDEVSIEDAKG